MQSHLLQNFSDPYQCCVENVENAGLGTWALVAHTDTSLPPVPVCQMHHASGNFPAASCKKLGSHYLKRSGLIMVNHIMVEPHGWLIA